jgi:3'-phosphoadenosine 5'-phosphosulfate sulfotransferase (PAPS reductase)/FAD synthetase
MHRPFGLLMFAILLSIIGWSATEPWRYAWEMNISVSHLFDRGSFAGSMYTWGAVALASFVGALYALKRAL